MAKWMQGISNYVDDGYFVVVETSYTNPKTGDMQISLKTLITGRGQKWILKQLNINQLQPA